MTRSTLGSTLWLTLAWSGRSRRMYRTQHKPTTPKQTSSRAITEPPTDATSVGSAPTMKSGDAVGVLTGTRSSAVALRGPGTADTKPPAAAAVAAAVAVAVVLVGVRVAVDVVAAGTRSSVTETISSSMSPVVTVLIRGMSRAAARTRAVTFCRFSSITAITSATGTPLGTPIRASALTEPADSSTETRSSGTFATKATLRLTTSLKSSSVDGTSANLA
mmetsp:Transcript_69359/g.212645  ORF Transcript_69359/g.212645 Transcript_69359/m.212645 type:complete len:219 (+) Transcript_69359:831-1487(+)